MGVYLRNHLYIFYYFIISLIIIIKETVLCVNEIDGCMTNRTIIIGTHWSHFIVVTKTCVNMVNVLNSNKEYLYCDLLWNSDMYSTIGVS